MSLLQGQRLLWRIFLHGLLVLAASGLTFVIFGLLLMRPAFERDAELFGNWIAPQICGRPVSSAHAEQPAPRFVAAVYSDDGMLRGSFVDPPPPLSRDLVVRLRREGSVQLDSGPVRAYACPAAAGAGYVILGRPPPGTASVRMVVPVILIIIFVALASLPLARSIATPLERVVEVTRAFGRGDLSARAESGRKDEVGDLARAFNDMAQRLETLLRAERELLANVSHELRTPLARIRVVLETAEEAPKRAQSLLGEIGKDLAELEGLVDNVMDAMRLDSSTLALSRGQLAARFTATDIQALVLDVVRNFRALHPERTIVFAPGAESASANADAALLRRLLNNLLENARKYSDAESPLVIRAKVDAETVAIAVLDRGIGIAQEDLPHVFEPFFRSDRSRSRATGGTGLGLALAKRIAEVHQGNITLESQLGRGTTVTFRLKRLLGPQQ